MTRDAIDGRRRRAGPARAARRGASALLLVGALLGGAAAAQDDVEAPDPSKAEVPLPALAGWHASLVHESEVGIWTCGTADVWVQHGCPDVFGLDDKGRCTFLMSYSGKWTPYQTVEDREWLGALAQVDLDPRIDGHEFYVGGKRGNLYQIRAYRDRTFDADIVMRVPGEEIHTIVGGDLLTSRPGDEVLVFTLHGDVYDVRPTGGGSFETPRIASVDARIRQALVLPTRDGAGRRILGVSRSGQFLSMRMVDDGLDVVELLAEPMGLGRMAAAPSHGAGGAVVVYVTRDDGVVLRLEESAAGAWSREVVYAGPQGPRGIAAGRFHEDPAVETLAVFGYSGRVQLLSRRPGAAWSAQTIFEDRDKGHWLGVAELDGRNATDELLASGYGGRIVLLSRPAGYGLDVATDDRPGPHEVLEAAEAGEDAAATDEAGDTPNDDADTVEPTGGAGGASAGDTPGVGRSPSRTRFIPRRL